MDHDTLQKYKNALEQERSRLVAELQTLAKPDPNIQGHWNTQFPKFEPDESGSHASLEEDADEVEEYEERLEAEHSFETRLLKITHALERIEKGTYGTCLACKQPIPLERLLANPEAEYDIEHESQ